MTLEIKTATTIEEQLARLKQRGMTIEDETIARDMPLDIGYYRLGFYWFPLEKKYPERDGRDHIFKTGASFMTAIHLYEFDRNFRNLLSGYLLDIEVNVRTKVIYYISNLHKDNPTWFADNNGCYGFNEEKTFPNYIEIVRSLRNNCAHGHPIFDCIFPKSLRAGKFYLSDN